MPAILVAAKALSLAGKISLAADAITFVSFGADLLGVDLGAKDGAEPPAFVVDFSAIEAQLADIGSAIDGLRALTEASISADISVSLGTAETALSNIRSFLAEDNPVAREVQAAAAIQNATEGLNQIMGQVTSIQGVVELETLTHAFSALHQAILIRQAVANTVQDGPLGAPGLHQQIKSAATILYNENDRESDLLYQMEQRVRDDVAESYKSIITSTLFEETTDINSVDIAAAPIARSTISDGVAEGQLIVREGAGPFVPGEREPKSEFHDRVQSELPNLVDQVAAEDFEALGLNFYGDIGRDLHLTLAETEADVATSNEFILSGGDDAQDGSDLADYISGRQGDDELSGLDGPDALNGGEGNDILRGGSSADMVRGGDGNDFLIAADTRTQDGTRDVARFEGLSTEHSIVGGSRYAVVTGADGERDKLFGFEYLRFDDGLVELSEGSALDGAGDLEDFITAESVALLYEAGLNRDGNIDRSGLNFWIDVANGLADDGMDQPAVMDFIAQEFIDSPEFANSFGDPGTLSNDEFLEQIYLNVLDRASDAAGRQFYLDLLDADVITRATALSDIAISPENTEGSVDVLMSLYETTTPEVHPTTNIVLDWYFVA
ncbi:MAG: DUF4214 domain-containing protein [Sulfitobacter sp.]